MGINMWGVEVADYYPMMLDLPRPPKAIFTTDVTTNYAPLSVQFTDISPFEPTGWQWNFGDGSHEQHGAEPGPRLQHPRRLYGEPHRDQRLRPELCEQEPVHRRAAAASGWLMVELDENLQRQQLGRKQRIQDRENARTAGLR